MRNRGSGLPRDGWSSGAGLGCGGFPPALCPPCGGAQNLPVMALWRWRQRRWERVRVLPAYYPPDFMRIRRTRRSERQLWSIETPELPLHGADSLHEALEALIRACKRPKGEGSLFKLELHRPPHKVTRIEPFGEDSLWDHGLFLQRLREPPDRWLLSLELARPVEGLYVSRWERYLAPWGVALEALLWAVKRGGPA